MKAHPIVYVAFLVIIILIVATFYLGGFDCGAFALLAVALTYAVMYHLNGVALTNAEHKLKGGTASTPDYWSPDLGPFRGEIEDLDLLEAGQEYVESLINADDLVHVVVGEERFGPVTRDIAAQKLLKMWKDGRKGGVTLDHLVYVGDHANEPYKTQANDIISDNI